MQQRTPVRGMVLGLAATALLTGGAEAARTTPGTLQQEARQELLRYVQVGGEGARALNLNDAQAAVVRQLEAGTVLAVHAERDGWLSVEAPGGFEVWVWGEFLAPTSEFGVMEVSASDLRMRPLPSSGIDSYPLEQRLGRGQKLRMIQRNDESLPLARDWVQVWSPPGARAWVKASETRPLAAGANGAALWAAAVTQAVEARKPSSGAREAAAGSGAAQASKPAEAGARSAPAPAQQVAAALQRADALQAAERKKDLQGGAPDYQSVLEAYQSVLALEPKGPTADIAAGRIATVNALAEAYRLKVDLELERQAREARVASARAEMEAAKNRDAFYGRFEARGWLSARTLPGREEPVWMLSWSGDEVAELVCHDGRFDLSVFDGFEVGVNGRQLRSVVEASAGRPARPALIDIARIEVLAGGKSRR